MVSNAGDLFAAPRIVAGPGGPRDVPGTVLLRSADPLGDYPVTVVHSLRMWADADPDHPLAAERGPDGEARVERLLVLARPPDLDAGEITDEGYVNQRMVLARRAALVELLYTDPVPDGVIVAG